MRRSVADRSVVGAAALVILAATTLLGAGVLYAEAVAQAGLTAQLQAGARDARGAQVQLSVRPADADATDASVRRAIDAALAGVGGTVTGVARSESWAIVGRGDAATPDLTVFESADGIADRTTLVAGAWPAVDPGSSPAAPPLEAALSEPAARALDVTVGTTLELQSRLDASRTIGARIVGIYRVTDPDGVAWWGDPLASQGVTSGSFRTIGPLVVDRTALVARTIVSRVALSWRIEPDLVRIGPNDLARLAGTTAALPQAIVDGLGVDSLQVRVDTALPEALRRAETALLSSSSGIVVIVGQLAILAGYALVLIAGVLLDYRRSETALLRARGTSTPRLLAQSSMEALLLVVPAVAAGPFLAAALLTVVDPAAPFATTGVPLHPVVSPTVVAIAAIVGVGCLVGLLLPAVASIGPIAAVRRTIGRQVRRTAAQRVGLDLVLVALALLGLWQLTRYGAPVVRTLRGTLGIDPVLVAAPALGLLAGAVLALRVVPLLGGVAERLVGARRGLVASLAARQLARRPLHASRSILLLAFAAGIAVFASGFAATWHRSQADQIAFAVGTDVRFDRAVRPTTPDRATSALLGAIPGVHAALPVVRESIDLGEAGRGQLLALPAAAASAGVAFRTDLADRPIRELLAELPGRPLPGVPIPPGAEILEVFVRADLRTVLPGEFWNRIPPGWPGMQVELVIRDGTGLISRFDGTPVPFQEEDQRVRIDLRTMSGDGAAAVMPVAPLELLAVELWVRMPENTAGAGELVLRGLSAHAAGDAPEAPGTEIPFAPDEGPWGLVANVPNSDPLPIDASRRDGLRIAIREQDPLAGPSVLEEPITGNREVRFAYRPAGFEPSEDDRLPSLAGDVLLAGLGAAVGDPVGVGERFADSRPLTVTAAMRGFPTIDPGVPSAVVDLGTLATREYVHTARTLQPTEWWVGADDAALDAVDTAIQGPAIGGQDIRIRAFEARDRLADPIAIGIVGALALGAAAAGVFATIGIVVSALVSLRQRGREVALLRALGLSTRQLVAALSAEHAFLLAVGSLIGIALGGALAFVVLPAVTLDQRAAVAIPPVHVEVPPEVPLALLGVAAAAFVVIVALQVRALRRDAPAAALRATEDEA